MHPQKISNLFHRKIIPIIDHVKELNERQIKAVLYVKEKGKITNKEYMEIAGISKATATRDLRELVEKKVFKQYGTKGQGISCQLIGS
jgi:ATP-dependent DNA helicase RecG